VSRSCFWAGFEGKNNLKRMAEAEYDYWMEFKFLNGHEDAGTSN